MTRIILYEKYIEGEPLIEQSQTIVDKENYDEIEENYFKSAQHYYDTIAKIGKYKDQYMINIDSSYDHVIPVFKIDNEIFYIPTKIAIQLFDMNKYRIINYNDIYKDYKEEFDQFYLSKINNVKDNIDAKNIIAFKDENIHNREYKIISYVEIDKFSFQENKKRQYIKSIFKNKSIPNKSAIDMKRIDYNSFNYYENGFIHQLSTMDNTIIPLCEYKPNFSEKVGE